MTNWQSADLTLLFLDSHRFYKSGYEINFTCRRLNVQIAM